MRDNNPNHPPAHTWPLPQGSVHWCLITGGASHHPYVARAMVTFYNAAVRSDMLVTKGKPFYGVDVVGGPKSELVPAGQLFPDTPVGQASAIQLHILAYKDSIRYHEAEALALTRKMEALQAQVSKLLPKRKPPLRRRQVK